MTVIAWDGKTLAADRAATNCGFKNTVCKVHRVPDGIVAFSGDGDAAMTLLEWFKAGRINGYPAAQTGDVRASAFFVGNDGRLLVYDKGAHPTPYLQPFAAMGSGRDYALAAMHLGRDAKAAVEVACALDSDCGNGIDTLTLD